MYFFPGRVRRFFLPGTLQVRSKHVNDTVRYGNFFLTPTVCLWTNKNLDRTLAIDSTFQTFRVGLLVEFID